MSNPTQETDSDGRGRYRAIEYSSGEGTVTVIQDSENDQAWIQSDQPMEVGQ